MSDAAPLPPSTTKRPAAKIFKFGYLVHDVSRIYRTVVDQAMRPLGLTRSQWTVLSALSRSGNDGLMQVDLARLLDVGKVTVGGLVDRLETAGYVERRPDVSDRRAKRVFITEQGYNLIDQMVTVTAALQESILRNVSQEQQHTCENVLYNVKKNLKVLLTE